MAKNYVYVMDHDTGFAPHIFREICSLSGCKNSKNGKRKNVEESAMEGSWVIGLGGKETRQRSKIIYAMRVKKNLLFDDFRREYPRASRYLRPNDPTCNPGSNVLVSEEFYYFGDKAKEVPKGLEHIVFDRHGCKCISDRDVSRLIEALSKYGKGKLGNPNNPQSTICKKSSVCLHKRVC